MTGRPRTFDEAWVLEKAMDLFWERGYEATGLAELISAMGIGRQSLYSAFGHKKQLYMRALAHYLDQGMQEIAAALQGEQPPLERLRVWLELKISGECTSHDEGRGCFAVNSIVELCPAHADVAELMREHFEALLALIAQALAEGQARAEIRRDKDPLALAQFLLNGSGGLIVASKLQLPREVGAGTVDFLIECLLPR